MTSKLKCPFCGEELFVGDAFIDIQYANCRNPGCKQCGVVMPVEIWQALIQAKQDLDFFKEEQDRSTTALIERTKELDKCQKDLEIATKALQIIANAEDNIINTDWCGGSMRANARIALKQIEHKD